jgi:hypothetical protein
MIARHWISCPSFTVEVKTNAEGRIVWTAPLVTRFKGQQLESLFTWVRGFGPMKHVVMGIAEEE